jgi:hypothetical protein
MPSFGGMRKGSPQRKKDRATVLCQCHKTGVDIRKRLAVLVARMSEQEIKQYLARIGGKGGKAGTGKSKRRGGSDFYKRLSKLAAKARKAQRLAANSKTKTTED